MKRRAWFAQIKPLLWLTIVTSAFLIEQKTYTLNIIVTSEDDNGSGTLREAIEDINAAVGTDSNSITFAPNVTTIKLESQLPSIENSVSINALPADVDCNTISPTDDSQIFSDTLHVTIDGSLIPPTGSIVLIGLLVCADDVTIKGIRVANFSNIEDARVAGIVSEGKNTILECCEVNNLNGNFTGNPFSTLPTIVGIQGNTDTIILNCFVHNLNSKNHTTTSSVTTGGISGITQFKLVRNSRVENIQSGTISYSPLGSSNGVTTLTTGSCAGITSGAPINEPCLPPEMRCECPTDCQGSDCILIENCVVNSCQTGSVFADADATVTINGSFGIIPLSSLSDIVIAGSTVCDIHTGNADLKEGVFDLRFGTTLGIFSSTEGSSCAVNNTIHTVSRGAVTMNTINSTAQLREAIGIALFSSNSIAQGNSVSNIHCQRVNSSGVCTTIQEFNSTSVPACIGNFANPISNITPICSGILLNGPIAQVCDNKVTNIDLGKRTTNGENDLIISSNADGIFIQLTSSQNEALVENNHVSQVKGASLIASPIARGIFGGSGSNGIEVTASGTFLEVNAQNNTISYIEEQSIQAASSVPHGYIFLTDIAGDSALRPAAQTVGLLIKSDQTNNNNPNGITALNNTVTNIVGSIIQGSNSNAGTAAIGIAIKPPIFSQSLLFKNLQSCIAIQNIFTPSTIQNNIIKNIYGGTNNAAYGVLLDATQQHLQLLTNMSSSGATLFAIEDNQINNIKGASQPKAISEATVVPTECGTETEKTVDFVRFPYQPTSGILTIFGNCSTISHNTISTVTESNNNARGITTQASSDMEINNNNISNINGYGIFVGGALAGMEFVNNNSGLLTEALFEDFFPSLRNKIYSNSTFDNNKDGIKLGLINWNNYFQVSEQQCGSTPPNLRNVEEIPADSVAIYGNHNQIKPQICNVQHNNDGTITIDYRLDSPEQPITKFAIQFFANKTNDVPHGRQHINNFGDSQFIFQTDIQGQASGSTTFMPIVAVDDNDIITAHVTVTTIGQSTSVDDAFKGDTSEFSVQSDKNTCLAAIMARPSIQSAKPSFASILNR